MLGTMRRSALFGLILLLELESKCHAQLDTGFGEHDSNGLMLRLGQQMQTKTKHSSDDSPFGGMYYDDAGHLVINQKRSRLSKNPFDQTSNSTTPQKVATYKEAILDLYGPAVLLSQIDPKRAEAIMSDAEAKAIKIPKTSGSKSTGDEMNNLVKKTLRSDYMDGIKLVFKTVRFSFQELYDDYQKLVPLLFELEEVSESDLDEANNRILVVVTSKSASSRVKKIVRKLGISRRKITIEISLEITVQLDDGEDMQLDDGETAYLENKAVAESDTLMDRSRPIRGGLFIEIPKPGKLQSGCSIGFVAQRARDSKIGFFTASHCTEKEAVLDGAKAYQTQFKKPNPNPPSEDLIGQELSEPIDQLPTWSDSSFFEFSSGLQNNGWDTAIHKTIGLGSNVKKTSGSTTWYSLRIDGDSLEGEVVYKVGRNTGMTRGKVVQTCVNVHTDPIPKRCQDKVCTDEEDVYFQWKGDSGAATIYTLSRGSRFAWIRGISWGKKRNGSCTPVQKPNIPISTLGCFDLLQDGVCWQTCAEDWDHWASPISNVVRDHGGFWTHYNDVRNDVYRFRIKHIKSGNCAYNSGGYVKNWGCWGDTNMMYVFDSTPQYGNSAVRIRHWNTNSCWHAGPNDGDKIHHSPCTDDPNMVYFIDFVFVNGQLEFRLRHKNSGKCAYGTTWNGGNLHSWGCWDDPNMRFAFLTY